jgi:hypothetical protein
MHSLFFKAQQISDANLDAKFYIKKIKSEVFRLDKVISFEQLVPSGTDLTNSYEAQTCNQLGLMRVESLKSP